MLTETSTRGMTCDSTSFPLKSRTMIFLSTIYTKIDHKVRILAEVTKKAPKAVLFTVKDFNIGVKLNTHRNLYNISSSPSQRVINNNNLQKEKWLIKFVFFQRDKLKYQCIIKRYTELYSQGSFPSTDRFLTGDNS